MLRAVAANLFSIFVPIYLLKTGYSVTWVCVYFCFYFLVRIFGDIASGLITARIGPKHTWILSHLSNIINLFCLLWLPHNAWLFWPSAAFNALGTSFQHIPLHVDFSKIKHLEHNGKEQSYFMLLEKVGAAVGPMLGGYIAAQYGASLAIGLSIVIYVASLIPLLSTPEPVKIKQKIKFKNFPYKKVWRDIFTHSMQGIDTTVTAGMWPMFMALFIFQGGVYEKVGFTSTLSIAVAIFMTYVFGKLIDNAHPLRTFRMTIALDSLVYVARIFTRSFLGVIGVNIANEVAYTGAYMAYNKGMYAAADDLPGYRIAYFTIMETVSEFVKGLMWLLLAVLSVLMPTKTALQVCFAVTAVAVLCITLERFRALRPRLLARMLS